jgi:TolB-like protein
MPDLLDSIRRPVAAFRENVTDFSTNPRTASKRSRLPSALPPQPLAAVIAPPDKAEIRATLLLVLANPLFCKAPRLSRLLRFLVERYLSDTLQGATEYGIGIDVFDRDPAFYSTGDDPIVRVQVGRLREKLKAYYSESARGGDVVISVPIGSYMPLIRRADDNLERLKTSYLLAVQPLKNLTNDLACRLFAPGLNEELSCRLFKEFGNKIVTYSFSQQGGNHPFSPIVSHLLEGSVRIDGPLMRVSVRLINALTGSIAWSDQLDRYAKPGIALQQDLAQTICAALEGYFFNG